MSRKRAPRRFMFGRRRMIAIHTSRLPVTMKANTRTAQGKPMDAMRRLSMMGYTIPAVIGVNKPHTTLFEMGQKNQPKLLPVAAMPVATILRLRK